MAAVEAKYKAVAGDGRYELFKSTQMFDGVAFTASSMALRPRDARAASGEALVARSPGQGRSGDSSLPLAGPLQRELASAERAEAGQEHGILLVEAGLRLALVVEVEVLVVRADAAVGCKRMLPSLNSTF